MKVVILAGGYGTRLSEETDIRPKPMVEIGNRPILWHIMKLYSAYGFDEFVVCCGYKADYIKDWFVNYRLRQSDLTIDLKNDSIEVHKHSSEPWRVTLVDTGEGTLTGGRVKRVADHLDETFFLTYGDGISNVDIAAELAFHRAQGTLATLTAVQPPGRFGAFPLGDSDTLVPSFHEKPVGDGAWINGGFFVCEPEVLDYIEGDATTWEAEPMERLAHEGQLSAYRHDGFWQPMDTLRDKMKLNELWADDPPWKVWTD
ncbi:MAG TPA: glucose-1-phosphate cytidylyltransferase [Acidimicrobiales bacterium]